VNIIDRYLLRQFVQTYLICWFSLLGLYVVFDAFTNLEEFIRCGEKSGGILALLGSFYGYQSIAFFDRTSALLALVAAMFTVSWLQRHNELTALMAAGIPRVRIVRPILAAAVTVSLIAAVNREVFLPRFSRELGRQPQDLIGDVGHELQPQYDNRTDLAIHGKATFADRQRIEEPVFVLPRGLQHYAKQIVAREARYCEPDGNRPGGYLLDDVQEPKDMAARPSLPFGDGPFVIAPRDAPDWLKPNQCFVVSDMTFDQLTGGRTFLQFASTRQLIAGLHNPSIDFGAGIRVQIHARIVQPILDVSLFFLGLPLVVTRQSRNVFVAIGLCLAVVTTFMLVVIGMQYLGSIYLISPALAAWLPVMIFVPAAVGMAQGMWE
jgi:lipopolysaccharide export system permease protein